MIPPQITIPRSNKCHQIVKDAVRFLQIFLIFGAFDTVKANIIYATNVTLSAVQAAVSKANAGDTVNVPAGTATWTSTLTINTDIQLIGAGIGQTVIIDGGSPSALTLIRFTTSSNYFDRLSGFEFVGANNAVNYGGSVAVSGSCHAFRMDNCEFTNLQNYATWFSGWVYGCVDHCFFYLNGTVGAEVEHNAYGGSSWGDGSWAAPDYWGTTNAIYFENDIFSQPAGENADGVVDSLYGARYVVRYCCITNKDIISHGTETGGRARGQRLMEVYDNTMFWDTNSPSPATTWAVYIRGGTAVVFSNSIVGGYGAPIGVAAYRQWINNWSPWGLAGQYDGVSPWNPIDTNSPTVYAQGTASVSSTSSLTDNTQNWTPNQWVGYWLANTSSGIASGITANTANTISVVAGYDQVSGSSTPAGTNMTFTAGQGYMIFYNVATIDQPGRGQGDLMADTVPGNEIPYNTVTGKTNWPNEALDPIYQWSNNFDHTAYGYPSYDYTITESTSVIASRDYYDGVPKPGYTPLPYPHPLDTTNSATTPSYVLTVVNGAGSGSYTNSTAVSISANAANTASNGAFAFWIGSNIANTNSASTTVTMPASSLTVTAIYAPTPPSSLQVLP